MEKQRDGEKVRRLIDGLHTLSRGIVAGIVGMMPIDYRYFPSYHGCYTIPSEPQKGQGCQYLTLRKIVI